MKTSFDETPMLVVVSDSLDPRIKRQLDAQLQAEMTTLGELETAIRTADNIATTKEEFQAAAGDKHEFEEENVKETTPPQAIENSDKAKEGNENDQQENNTDNNDNDPFSSDESSNSDESAKGDNGTGDNNESDENSKSDEGGNGESNDGNGSGQSTGNDPFASDGESNNQNSNSGQSGQQSNSGSTGKASDMFDSSNATNNDSSDDPVFESVMAYYNSLKKEAVDNPQTADSSLPPQKHLVHIRGNDGGIDTRTKAVLGTLQDPNNIVVLLDLSDVAEIQAKVEFEALKKDLQSKGVMVVDTIDEAIGYLNHVYDEVTGGNKQAT